jgi:hypothetical protein
MRKQPRTRVLVSAAIVTSALLWTSDAVAGDCLTPEVKLDSSYHYILALVGALGMAKSADDRVTEVKPSPSNALAGTTQTMLALKLSNADLECALKFVSPYKTSGNDPIKTSAEAAETVFTGLISLQNQHVALLKKLWDDPKPDERTGSYLEEYTELGAKADDLWKTLPVAAVTATYAVIEADPTTGKMTRFNLTAPQRDEILRELVKTFGVSIQKGMQVGQKYTDISAAALYKFLSDKRWKTRSSAEAI